MIAAMIGTRRGPGPRDRARSRRRLRRQDQHLRRGVRRRAALSKRLGIPVKWIEDRSEAFVATTHGRDILGYVDLAAKRDGTVLGLKMRLIADIGAYNMLLTAAIPTLTMLMANATYDIPAIRVDAHRGLHQQDADRCLPRRRTPGGHLLRRARAWTCWRAS